MMSRVKLKVVFLGFFLKLEGRVLGLGADSRPPPQGGL